MEHRTTTRKRGIMGWGLSSSKKKQPYTNHSNFDRTDGQRKTRQSVANASPRIGTGVQTCPEDLAHRFVIHLLST